MPPDSSAGTFCAAGVRFTIAMNLRTCAARCSAVHGGNTWSTASATFSVTVIQGSSE